MIDTELQDRVNRAIDDIDKRIKNWESVKFDLNRLLDDEWDFEHEVQEAAMEAALDQLTSIRKILAGESSG